MVAKVVTMIIQLIFLLVLSNITLWENNHKQTLPKESSNTQIMHIITAKSLEKQTHRL